MATKTVVPKSKQQDKAVSCKGEALWAFLTVPDKRWKAVGEYKVSLIVEPGKEAAAFIVSLEKIRDEYFDTLAAELPKAKVKKLSKREVYSDHLDAAGEETGKFEFKFSSNAGGVSRKTGKDWSFEPRIYDSRAQLIKGKINIGNGSILQVNFTPAAYMLNTDSSVGCKMYVNDVMIHKLVEYGGDPGFSASEAEGGFQYDDGTVAPEGFKAGDGTDTEDAQNF